MMAGPGLFGKTPETGDFISRGLSPACRRGLDRWVTSNLAEHREGWPAGGLRGLLEIEAELVLIVAVASRDSVGRRYPLLAVTAGQGVSLEVAETWCGAAADILDQMVGGDARIDDALTRLSAIEPEIRDGPPGSPALWVAGEAPCPCDADSIRALFSSG